ncbi:MAG: phosphoglycerate mutase family protein [Parcubacteria group bacterium]|nr:phosphoglycerate mutase family protein [Parcubacteria group bacterium]
MTMPRTLTKLRHGESEGNFAKRAFEQGTPILGEEALMAVHTSERRLTKRGIEQAKAAGAWLRENWYDPELDKAGLQRMYVSPYARAMETAGHLGFGTDWRPDARIVERNWGEFDQMPYGDRLRLFEEQLQLRKNYAFYWRPTNGETFQDVFNRLRDLLGTLHRECSNMDVLEVSHGETMWVGRDVVEKLMPQELRDELMNQTDQTRIHNCRIIQYTRQCEDGSWSERLERMRFISPERADDPKFNTSWLPIKRKKWSHQDLLDYVGELPTFIPEAA